MTNKYQIIDVIGEGAYGIVYKCIDRETNETLAIKKLLEEYDKLPKKEINREIYALQVSNHENIVKFIEAILNKGYLYIVTEYADKNLLQIIEENPKGLNPELIRSFIYQLCKAVSYLNSKNIIHRDIKPENILVNNNSIIKLCDFGLARKLKIDPKTNYYGKMTDYMATRWYRAPELILSQGIYGPEIDFWSIGCIMGELADGKPVFPGDNQINQLEYIIKLIGNLPEKLVEYYNKNPVFNVNKLFIVEKPETLEKRYENIMSPDAIDFMKGLLELDPNKRLNADNVFEHKYFDCFKNAKKNEKNEKNKLFSLSIDQKKKIKIPNIKTNNNNTEKDSNIINIFRYNDESFISETNESTLSKKKLKKENNNLMKSFQPEKKKHFRSDMFDFGKLYLNSIKDNNQEKSQDKKKEKEVQTNETKETIVLYSDNNCSNISNKQHIVNLSPEGLKHKKSLHLNKKGGFSESKNKYTESKHFPYLTPIFQSQNKLKEKKRRTDHNSSNFCSLISSHKMENNKIPLIDTITHKSKKLLILPKFNNNKKGTSLLNKKIYNSVGNYMTDNKNDRNKNYYSLNKRKSIDFFTKDTQIIYENDEFNSKNNNIVNLYENSFKDVEINSKEKERKIPNTIKKKRGISGFFRNFIQKKANNNSKKRILLPPLNLHNEILNINKKENSKKKDLKYNLKFVNNRY